MTSPDVLSLHFTVEQVEGFCRHLASHAPGSEQHLAALTALQTFVASGADAGEQARPVYQAIRQAVERHLEQARAVLMQQNVQRLRQALEQRNVSAVAALYRPLSRSGFWEALTRAAGAFDDTALSDLARWSRQWVEEAKRRGEQASGFPDAIDFHKAGIDVTEYTAMSDVQRFTAGRLP
jgi:deoxyribodipyrimidine photolyase